MASIIPKSGLNFAEFGERLDNEVVAFGNLLERERPQKRQVTTSARSLLRFLVLVSDNTYRTMRYFCADLPESDRPKSEYALSAPPLARTVLDALFTVVFLFDDLDSRISWYLKSGWREYADEHERLRTTYGSDPQWSDFLTSHAAVVESERLSSGVTVQEQTRPRIIPWWPIPGQIINHQQTSQVRRDYLKYLNDWFYRELSQDSHLSWRGLVRRVAYLVLPKDNEAWERVQKQKSDSLFTTVILLLAMISEIEIELGYERRERLGEIWKILLPYSIPATEIFELRYKAHFER